MSKMIQIRNVPDDLHRKMKARAAMEGMTLSDYLLRELRHLADQSTVSEFLERLRQSSGEGLGAGHRLVLVAFARTGFGHQVGELLLLQPIDFRYIDHADPVGR